MNIRDKYKELTGEFATHYQGISDEFTEDYKKWLEQQVEKLFTIPVGISVCSCSNPEPIEYPCHPSKQYCKNCEKEITN